MKQKNHRLYYTILKKIYVGLLYPFIAAYIKKERAFHYQGLHLRIFPGVFHPAFFFSTKFFFSFISKLPLENKSCLEIGSGSGLLSILMSRKKALVTAIDINPLAIKNTLLNYELNKSQLRQEFTVQQSDMYTNLPAQKFDCIIVAPPYFFTDPKNDSEHAWFCGKNGEYFYKLFSGLNIYFTTNTSMYMILADNCDLERIQKIAAESHFSFELADTKRIWWEENYIFKISKSA